MYFLHNNYIHIPHGGYWGHTPQGLHRGGTPGGTPWAQYFCIKKEGINMLVHVLV